MKQITNRQVIHLSSIEKAAGFRVRTGAAMAERDLRFNPPAPVIERHTRDISGALGRTMAVMAAALMVFFYPGGVIVADAEEASSETTSSSAPAESAPAATTTAVAEGSEATQQVTQTVQVSTTTEVQSETTPPATTPSTEPQQTHNPETQTQADSTQKVDQEQDVKIDNDVDSSAESGDALVKKSNDGGDATSGDSTAIANVMNLLNSAVSGGEVTTFTQDIFGNVFGDLIIDPGALPTAGSGNLELNADVNATINNNVNLQAKTGDATLQNNAKAGDATTGNALAMANIVNLINSAISTGGTFMGVINIYGNLNGDILLPDWLLESLLNDDGTACNDCPAGDVNATINNNHMINNNVTASAKTGNAIIENSGGAGAATSGDAQTDVTILNLSSSNVVAANSLLVFVNVMGRWVGVIVDAPAGATSAALATDIQEGSCVSCPGGTTDATMNANYMINNNVSVSATTGNALIQNNGQAGDATTGDATAKVNIANIINSSFNLSGWLGVLFINVFGTWNGSFGVDTAAGEPPATQPGQGGSKTNKPKVFRFVPGGQGGGMTLSSVDMSNPETAAAVDSAVKDAKKKLTPMPTETHKDSPKAQDPQQASADSDFLMPLLGLMIGGSLLGGERYASRRQRRKML